MELISLPSVSSTTKSPTSDFINNFETVRSWYRYNPFSEVDQAIAARSEGSAFREKLSAILLEQHTRWPSTEATTANIEALAKPNTYAVVTGQQAGVFGGPLYTIYKTISVLKLCQKLQRDFPDKHFVPVFWLEVNDSDFEEISVVQYATKDNEMRHLKLKENAADQSKPVDNRQIDAALAEWKETVSDDFFDTEFKADALDMFFQAYRDGSYTDGFARLMLRLFGDKGIVLINPASKEIGELALPLYEQALTKNSETIEVLKQRSSDIIAAGYDPQISIRDNQTLLFYVNDEGRRLRLDTTDTGTFVAKDGDSYSVMSKDRLLQPGALTPNVALRPVLQDFLLPTVAYVGGPGEIAYFSQVEALYRCLDIEMPLLYPRHRVSLIEKKVARMVDKLGLDMHSVLTPGKASAELIERGGSEIFKALDDAGIAIQELIGGLKDSILAADPQLESAFNKTGGSINNSFGKLTANVKRSLEQKNDIQMKQLAKIELSVLPEGKPQERVFSYLYFAVKYGPDFLDELMNILPLDTQEPFVIAI
ncbi:MAG: bacillithiol biosynthesis cysteine-adding enzyme BshC [Calditrichia bacterium]